jgi:thymidylate synthase (FAD)
MVLTMNVRSLNNFFHHRCCNRAQWEIRDLAEKMLKVCKEAAPELFKKSGPPCAAGPCPEGKMSCGKVKEMRERFLNL